MLFRKDIDPRCAYCQRGQQINDREVACVKRGHRTGGGPLPGVTGMTL